MYNNWYNNVNEEEVLNNFKSPIKRYDVINYLIEKYELNNYLEIGVYNGDCIRQIKASHKDGVDPGSEGFLPPEVNYPIPSDEFFKLIENSKDIKYDAIFIDGLHHADQVERDIKNSLNHTTDNGFIILHDCNPPNYRSQLIPRQTTAWNGDVWKAFVNFKINNPTYKCCVVDTDFGIGVIHNNGEGYTLKEKIDNWGYFDSNRKELLNLISWDEFKATY